MKSLRILTILGALIVSPEIADYNYTLWAPTAQTYRKLEAVTGMSSTLTINTNLASLNAQRRLGESTASLQRSFERLSSGLRINKASDDAAGLAIASSLNVDSRVYTQGTRNTNDAISLYSIAEGALNSLVDITTRLKELAQQSSNGVLSFTQRKSLDAEAQALGKEYQRIVQTTQFNGKNLINSGNGPLSVQVGYDALSLSGGNAATGTFASAHTYVTGNSPVSVTTADVNRDGIADLISADVTGNDLSVFLGNGNGTFQASQAYTTGASPLSVTTADVNRDGIADLISADRNSNQISVFLGNGNGTFQASQAYVTGANPISIASADVNGDGIADLISADVTGNDLSVFLGNGNGTFQARQNYTTGNGARSVTTADVNGDGFADLISVDYGSSDLSVFLGNGNGTFQARQSYVTGNSPVSVTTADINGDAIADLISADYFGSTLSVFLGNGNGTFHASQAYAAGVTPNFVTAADVNGDGVADLISTNSFSSQLSVFLGNSSAQAVVAPTVGTYSLLSQQSSLQALTQFGKVLDRLTASLGQVGANESRLQTVTSVLQETRINYDSAASQIQDVDVATEAANLAKGNILQQAGAAILAQANQQPALALRLLQGLR